MPRRSILSTAEEESLPALPNANDDLIRHYAFTDTDLYIIKQHRGPANRLGFRRTEITYEAVMPDKKANILKVQHLYGRHEETLARDLQISSC